MKRFLLIVMLSLLLAACGGAAVPNERVSEEAGAAPPPAAEPSSAEREATDGAAGGENQGVDPALANRKIIYTGFIQLRVAEPREVAQSLQGLAAQYGGYVSSANVYEYREGEYRASVQLRVSAEQFDATLAALRALGDEVLSEQLDTQDVTDQYVDLTARIENLERTEHELQALLSEAREQGGDTEDILQIYRELTNVREQIELYQGQLNVLADAVTLATINVELVPPEAEVEIVAEGWSATRTIRQAIRTLTEALQGLADFLIYFLITGLPVLLVLALFGWLLFRFMNWLSARLRRPKPPAAPVAPASEATSEVDES